jgi:molybdopterin/thiamine biosynthesis adenylyltransferase
VSAHNDTLEAGGQMVRHTLSNGRQIELPPHEVFYAQLITRNRGLVAEDDQERLRHATLLVAGCGSTGGAVIEPLVRFGAEHLLLAEPDGYDLHNLNRQSARLQDLGRNKAEVFQERMHDINPYAQIEVQPHGITGDNVDSLVRHASLIVDAVDVTTRAPLRAKYALHQQAQHCKVPVIAGYDIAGLQLIHIHDYRTPSRRVLNGRVREDEVEDIDPMVFLRRIVPIAAIPYEMIGALRSQLRGERQGFPQIVYTAQMFGVLALPAVLDLLAGRPVRRRVIVDIPTLLRPRSARLRISVARWSGLYHLYNEFRRSRSRAK